MKTKLTKILAASGIALICSNSVDSAFANAKYNTPEFEINKDIIEGKWENFKGDVQKKWGKLTNDDLDKINGNLSKLSGKIQEKYGQSKAEADKAVQDWKESIEHKLK